VHLVVIAPHLQQNDEALRELYELLFWPVRITSVASFYELITGRVPPSTFTEDWFLSNLANIDTPIYNKFRRGLDILAAIIMALTMTVLFPPIALGIICTSKGPIFFDQKRVGQFGNIFKIHKFRSMYALAPDGSAETSGAQFAEKEDDRITPFGKFLRKMRLDELPQALNLLRGDITLVGPRPERPEIVKKLEEAGSLKDSDWLNCVTFTPDGKQVAFISDRAGNPQLYVLDLAAQKTRKLTRMSWCDSPNWSPSGEWIVFAGRESSKEKMNIFISDLTGGQIRRLISASGDNEDPSWSPDGRFIAFTSTRRGKRELFVMDSDGSAPHPLTDLKGKTFTPNWSP